MNRSLTVAGWGLAAILAGRAWAGEEVAVIETIDETTVGDLGGVRVPMGNMTTGTYTLPDGTEKSGPICSLALPGPGPGVFVGVGSVVTVEGARWQVIEVDSPPTGLGSVSLKLVR